jgi:anamorsin
MNDIILNNIFNSIAKQSRLLFVWSGNNVPEDFPKIIEHLQAHFNEHKISVEHVDRLLLANYSQSSFDCILSNMLTTIQHTTIILNEYLKLLKPKGSLILWDSSANLESELKLNGFANVKASTEFSLPNSNLISFYSEKPNFEVGSVRKLNLTKKPPQQKQPNKVWQLASDDIGESDLIDTDALLDEDDLKKPDLSKYDCGTSDTKTGKKKACKNCSCGLAEELEKGVANEIQSQPKASACGSCYLGDAFRCASCPYLGMPSFKPGEKIQLNDRLLKADS